MAPRGGKRPGAGRPVDPLRGKKIKRSLWLHKDAWEYLSRIADNRSEAIEKIIKERTAK
jgi:hypothetical protein